jgi:hypothetical protein
MYQKHEHDLNSILYAFFHFCCFYTTLELHVYSSFPIVWTMCSKLSWVGSSDCDKIDHNKTKQKNVTFIPRYIPLHACDPLHGMLHMHNIHYITPTCLSHILNWIGCLYN